MITVLVRLLQRSREEMDRVRDRQRQGEIDFKELAHTTVEAW